MNLLCFSDIVFSINRDIAIIWFFASPDATDFFRYRSGCTPPYKGRTLFFALFQLTEGSRPVNQFAPNLAARRLVSSTLIIQPVKCPNLAARLACFKP